MKEIKTAMEEILKDQTELNRIKAEICRRSFRRFVEEFWSCVATNEFISNWHIDVFCDELSILAYRVGYYAPKEYDLIINVPPGTTKTIIFSIMFPVWCWVNWYWMRFITASYSSPLSLESAEYSRDLVKSDKFSHLFPHLEIKHDKDTKGNFRIQKTDLDGTVNFGGNRYSTSVGGTLTGFHGHILIVDDPLNPTQAVSEVELKNSREWMDRTLSTRKVDKQVTPTVLIMQRLSQGDPSGHWLSKQKKNVRHICLPGEIKNYSDEVKPLEMKRYYTNGLLDVRRMNWDVLKEMEADLGQYGYAGQIGQRPTPPGGGMFKVDHFPMSERPPGAGDIIRSVRYWDKAGTHDGGAFTVGCKMHLLKDKNYFISDVKRGQWASEEREKIIKQTTKADGLKVEVFLEQEPGSSGKESVESSIKNLAGFIAHADRPTGDKVFRADPYSVQVNNGNVILLTADWNYEFIEEHRHFPMSTYKDQVDASSGSFSRLNAKRRMAGTF